MSWAPFSVDCVADTSSVQLRFLGRANAVLSNEKVIVMDSVAVEWISGPVPEPSSWALMATGLEALAFFARRRRLA